MQSSVTTVFFLFLVIMGDRLIIVLISTSGVY